MRGPSFTTTECSDLRGTSIFTGRISWQRRSHANVGEVSSDCPGVDRQNHRHRVHRRQIRVHLSDVLRSRSVVVRRALYRLDRRWHVELLHRRASLRKQNLSIARIAVGYQFDTINCSVFLKQGSNRNFGSIKAEVSNKNTFHFSCPLESCKPIGAGSNKVGCTGRVGRCQIHRTARLTATFSHKCLGGRRGTGGLFSSSGPGSPGLWRRIGCGPGGSWVCPSKASSHFLNLWRPVRNRSGAGRLSRCERARSQHGPIPSDIVRFSGATLVAVMDPGA